jgi:hypothetical protein
MGYNPFQAHLNSNSSAVRNQITNVKVGSIDVGATEFFPAPGIVSSVGGGLGTDVPQSSPKGNAKAAADRDVALMTWLSNDEISAFVDADCRAGIDSALTNVLQSQVCTKRFNLYPIYVVVNS